MNTISNNKLTLLRKLNQKKYRQREQLFLVEGVRAVRQIIENDAIKIEQLFFDEGQSIRQEEFWQRKMEQFSASLIPEHEFADVSDTDNPQGILAMCKMPEQTGTETLIRQKGVSLAVDRIQDPGNMGTIIRTAAWFGVQGLLVGKGTVDLFHPKVVRSTAGAIGIISFQLTDLNEVLPEFEKAGWQAVLLAAGASDDIRTVAQTNRTIIVIGNEANGIADELFIPGRTSVHIPSATETQRVESLNAAIASAVALYEFG